MSRAPGTRTLVLPAPYEKYDATNERETRRLLEQNARQLNDYSTLTSIPAPVSALGGLTGAVDTFPYFTGLSTMALAALTPYARTILACASAATMRTALGLGPLAILTSPSDATKFLNGDVSPTFAQVKDSDLSLSNITTNNVSVTKHGFAPILPNDATKFLNGVGAYAVPGGAGGAIGALKGDYSPSTTTYVASDLVRYRRNAYVLSAGTIAAGSTVDTTHALFTSLTGLYPLYEGIGNVPVNLIDSSTGTLVGASIPLWDKHRVLTFRGGGTTNSTAQLYAAGAGTGMSALQGGAFTIWMRVSWDGAAAGLCERNDNNSTSGFMFGVTAGGALGLVFVRATSDMSAQTANVLAPRRTHSVAITYDGSATIAGIKFYVDSALQATTTSSLGAGAIGTGDGAFPYRLGNNQFSNGPLTAASFNGRIYAHMVWKGVALTAANMVTLETNPLMPNLPNNTAKWTAITGAEGGIE